MKSSHYCWYILSLATATHIFAVAMPMMCMPVLFSEIAGDLNLNLVQIGTVWGAGYLAGAISGLGGGLIGDRYGTKRTLITTCLLGGITGALRGIATSFIGLSTTVFFFGFMTTTISLNAHKVAGEQFSRHRLGIANGILSAGMGIGFMLGSMISATVLSPLLGGWRNVLFLYGSISILFGFLWFLPGREPDQLETTPSPTVIPFRQALVKVLPMKNVWLIALVRMFFTAATVGYAGYLPLFLRGVGWTAVSADGALAAATGVSTIGVIALTLLSDKLGLRKVVLIATALVVTTGIGLLSVLHNMMVWLIVVLVGFVREGFVATTITTTMETRGVGSQYAGTALGITVAFMNLGGFFGPPLGNSLATINAGLPFAFWAAMGIITLLVILFVEETGQRKGGLTSTNQVT